MFNLTLEKLAYLGTAASAVATLLLVCFAVYQLRVLIRQLHLYTKAVDATTRAADAAQEAARETARVRIDEQAPRVIALSEPVQWPPLLARDRTGMPQANELRMFDAMSLHGSANIGDEEFIFPEQADQFLWFRMRGVLINEGRTTARVRLDGEGRFIAGTSDLLPSVQIPCPPLVGRENETYIGREYLLRPDQPALFEWAYGHRLEEWAGVHEAGQPPVCEVDVVVFDSTEHGILDTIRITLEGRPLEPVPGRAGHWRLRQEPRPDVLVYPTKRVYRGEAPAPS